MVLRAGLIAPSYVINKSGGPSSRIYLCLGQTFQHKTHTHGNTNVFETLLGLLGTKFFGPSRRIGRAHYAPYQPTVTASAAVHIDFHVHLFFARQHERLLPLLLLIASCNKVQ